MWNRTIVLIFILLLSLSNLSIAQEKQAASTNFAKDLFFAVTSSENKENNFVMEKRSVKIPLQATRPQGLLDWLAQNSPIQPKEFRFIITDQKDNVAFVKISDNFLEFIQKTPKETLDPIRAEIVFNLTEFEGVESVFFLDNAREFSRGFANRYTFLKAIPKEQLGGWLPYHFLIQVASRQDVSQAENLCETLKEKNYPCNVQKVDLGKIGVWFRVRVGPYYDFGEAVKESETLKKTRGEENFILKEKIN